ncbi:MAG: hypothetical protein ACJAYU_002284 [Bradymonadia bacterium]|jgi:hypothetical protein
MSMPSRFVLLSAALSLSAAMACGGASVESPVASDGPDWAALRASFVESGEVPEQLLVPSAEAAALLPVLEPLVALNTEAGQQLLADADADADYVALMEVFEAQQYRSYCGVATSVMVLGAIGVDGVNQDNFFEPTAEVAPQVQVLFGGMNLQTLAALLRVHGEEVTAEHGGDITVDEFRAAIVENLGQAGDYVAVNYLRAAIGQETGGHISPLGAYDAETDQVLVLDVAAHKYPSVWVSVQGLYDAINTVDSDGGATRGVVFVGPWPVTQ